MSAAMDRLRLGSRHVTPAPEPEVAGSASHGRRRKAAGVIGLGTAIALVSTTGVAFAYYKTTISGTTLSNAASVAAASAIGFSVTGQSPSALYPGASGNVTVTLTNPYSQTITLTGVTGSVSTNKAGCTDSDFTVASSPSGLPASLTANQTSSGVVLTNAVTMKTSAADACRGASITATLSVTGRL